MKWFVEIVDFLKRAAFGDGSADNGHWNAFPTRPYLLALG